MKITTFFVGYSGGWGVVGRRWWAYLLTLNKIKLNIPFFIIHPDAASGNIGRFRMMKAITAFIFVFHPLCALPFDAIIVKRRKGFLKAPSLKIMYLHSTVDWKRNIRG